MVLILIQQEGFWERVFPTAVGAIIGGLITIAALVLKELFDRRRAVQSWYEDTYISEGIDRLIVYLSGLESVLSNLSQGYPDDPALNEPYPRQAVERFRTLFPNSTVPGWISVFRDNCEKQKRELTMQKNQHTDTKIQRDSEPPGIQRAHGIVIILMKGLRSLECELLQSKVARKAQVHTIREREKIGVLIEDIEQSIQAARAQHIG